MVDTCCCAQDNLPDGDVKVQKIESVFFRMERDRPGFAAEGVFSGDSVLPAAAHISQIEHSDHAPMVRQPAAFVPVPASPWTSKDVIEWEVAITKRPGKTIVGLQIDSPSETAATVWDLKENSLISEWNEQHPDKQVYPGDAIMAVNGATHYHSVVHHLMNDTLLKLSMRRVLEFVVCVDKGDAPLGMSLAGSAIGPTVIEHVADDHVISAYNTNAEPGKAVVPGLILQSVNGESGDRKKLADAIRGISSSIALRFRHPCAEASEVVVEDV